ncbi:hypothetical protein SynA1825c_01073 [Synechococcus sp. A18-25c]|nr:hypothetical protein SynA1825c_01073 [Synechococcus sp. A18-25c]
MRLNRVHHLQDDRLQFQHATSGAYVFDGLKHKFGFGSRPRQLLRHHLRGW